MERDVVRAMPERVADRPQEAEGRATGRALGREVDDVEGPDARIDRPASRAADICYPEMAVVK